MKKVKKVKKVKYTHGDILHMFANGVTDATTKYSGNNVSIYRDVLRYNNRTVAKIYSRRKNIVIIDSKFNDCGAWGNKINNWNIARAFSDKWTIIQIDFKSHMYSWNVDESIFIPSLKDLAKDKESFFKAIVEKYLNEVITTKSHLDDVIYGRHMTYYRNGDIINDIQNEFKEVQNILKIPNKYINCKVKKHSTAVLKYRGWNDYYDYVHLKDFKPKEYLIDYKLSDEELHILARKEWIYNWVFKTYRGSWSKQAKIDLYEDVEARTAWEKTKTEKDKRDEEYRRTKRERENAIRRENEKDQLDKWLKGSNNSIRLWYSLINLRFNPSDDTQIQTSAGASVPTTHGKLLYRKFKQCIADDKEFISNGNTISIGHYKVERISKTTDDRWYLKAGCHIIYKAEIDKFIELNNLDW